MCILNKHEKWGPVHCEKIKLLRPNKVRVRVTETTVHGWEFFFEELEEEI